MQLLVLLLLALLCMAPIQGYHSAAHGSAPGSCGAACSESIADFPSEFWDRQMKARGTAAGASSDGSYWYLGENQRAGTTYGYIVTTDHVGGSCSQATNYRFLVGSHAGKHYQCVRSLKLTSGLRTHVYTTGMYTTRDTFNIVELTTMQKAPGCTAANAPVACCDAYYQGDGTCAGSPACDGGGCVTDALPGYSFPAMANPELISDGAIVIGFGAGNVTSNLWEWYLECNSDPVHGGLGGAPNACCSGGIEFSRVSGDFTAVDATCDNPSCFTTQSATLGGTGHNCDTYGGGPGYTYLGPVGMGAPADQLYWFAETWDANDSVSWQVDLADPAGCIVSTSATGATDTAAQHLAGISLPSVRSSARALCGTTLQVTGDSGSPLFVKESGTWKFLGPLRSTSTPVAESIHALQWWWVPRALNVQLGGK